MGHGLAEGLEHGKNNHEDRFQKGTNVEEISSGKDKDKGGKGKGKGKGG